VLAAGGPALLHGFRIAMALCAIACAAAAATAAFALVPREPSAREGRG